MDDAGSRVHEEISVDTGVLGRTIRVWSWLDSHSAQEPMPGPHLALHGLPQKEGEAQSLVVHLDQVPTLVAALTRAAAHLAAVWEQVGGSEAPARSTESVEGAPA